jgi:NAD-dependent dihydropyrimidine dehydrogenase PreA subunit
LLGLALLPVSFGYLVYGRFMLGQLNFYTDKCVSCGLCAQKCPTGSLVMRPAGEVKRPYWKLSCASCMRCINGCPYKAIEESHLWMLLLWVLVSWPLLPSMIKYLGGGSLPPVLRHQPLAFLLNWANLFFLLSLSSVIFWKLQSVGGINRLFVWGSLPRFYGRYNAAACRELEGK